MLYKFAEKPTVVTANVTIFVGGDNAQGVWQDGVLLIQSSEERQYKYENGGWYIKTPLVEEYVACGVGAVPTLEIDNLQVVNKTLFESIQYVPHEE